MNNWRERATSILLFLLVSASLVWPCSDAQKNPPPVTSPDIHYRRGVEAASRRDFPTALREFRLAVRYAPRSAPAHNSLGWAYLQVGKVDKAIPELRQAITLSPKFAQAHRNLGEALQRQDDLDGAIKSYQEALLLQPNWADVHELLGVVLGHRGNLLGARHEFETAVELNPR